MRAERNAFTLVEILVVTTIIALLISILMPSLARARHQVRETVCGNNLKQLHGGITYYLHDHDDVLPPFRTFGKPITAAPDANNKGWAEVIDKYIPTECVRIENGVSVYGDVHHCPEKLSNDREGDPTAPITGSYGINAYLSSFVSWKLNKPVAVFKWVKLSRIKRPAEMVLVTESCRMVTLPALPPGTHMLVRRHREFNFANVAWLDGHVDSALGEKLIELKASWDPWWRQGQTYTNGIPD